MDEGGSGEQPIDVCAFSGNEYQFQVEHKGAYTVTVGTSGVHVVEEQVIFLLTGRTDGPMPSIWQLLKKLRKIEDSYILYLSSSSRK